MYKGKAPSCGRIQNTKPTPVTGVTIICNVKMCFGHGRENVHNAMRVAVTTFIQLRTVCVTGESVINP